MQTSPESYLVDSYNNFNNFQIGMKTKEKIYVFDLDDTLVQTTKFDPEFWVHNFKHLKLFENVEKVLDKLGRENCILLTFDEHHLQQEKIEKLHITGKFKEIHIVKNKI